MTTETIFTTIEGNEVVAELSPRRNTICRLVVDGLATDARIDVSDSLEDATFQVSSSTPLKGQFEEIAKAALEFLNRQ